MFQIDNKQVYQQMYLTQQDRRIQGNQTHRDIMSLPDRDAITSQMYQKNGAQSSREKQDDNKENHIFFIPKNKPISQVLKHQQQNIFEKKHKQKNYYSQDLYEDQDKENQNTHNQTNLNEKKESKLISHQNLEINQNKKNFHKYSQQQYDHYENPHQNYEKLYENQQRPSTHNPIYQSLQQSQLDYFKQIDRSKNEISPVDYNSQIYQQQNLKNNENESFNKFSFEETKSINNLVNGKTKEIIQQLKFQSRNISKQKIFLETHEKNSQLDKNNNSLRQTITIQMDKAKSHLEQKYNSKSALNDLKNHFKLSSPQRIKTTMNDSQKIDEEKIIQYQNEMQKARRSRTPQDEKNSLIFDNKQKQKSNTPQKHSDHALTFKVLQDKLNYLQKKIENEKNENQKIIDNMHQLNINQNSPKYNQIFTHHPVVKDSQVKQENSNYLKTMVTSVDLQSPKQYQYQNFFQIGDDIIKNRPKFQQQQQLYYISKVIDGFSKNKNPIINDHFVQTLQALHFVNQIQMPTSYQIEAKKVYLPKAEFYKNKKTIIFDLDETLIHCNDENTISDVNLKIKFPNGEQSTAGINIRPYLEYCLNELSQIYELIVFTASHSCYANVVLDHIDPHKKIQHRLYRDSCIHTKEGVYVKDLRVIGNRNLQDMILIDNAAYSFGFQLDNGLPIIAYYDDQKDQELLSLTNFLKKIQNVPDFRTVIRTLFQLHKYTKFNNPLELLKTLYPECI